MVNNGEQCHPFKAKFWWSRRIPWRSPTSTLGPCEILRFFFDVNWRFPTVPTVNIYGHSKNMFFPTLDIQKHELIFNRHRFWIVLNINGDKLWTTMNNYGTSELRLGKFRTGTAGYGFVSCDLMTEFFGRAWAKIACHQGWFHFNGKIDCS